MNQKNESVAYQDTRQHEIDEYWRVRKHAKHLVYEFPDIPRSEIQRICGCQTETLDRVVRHLEKAGAIRSRTAPNGETRYRGGNWITQLMYYWFFTS